MDLVLHAGLSKTGSTTIQTHILPGLPGYLGKVAAPDPSRENTYETKELKKLSTQHHFLAHDTVQKRTKAWANHVYQLTQDSKSSIKQIMISEEKLCHWPLSKRMEYVRKPYSKVGPFLNRAKYWQRKHPIPLAIYIDKYLKPAWSHHGKIKLCIVLRNQSEWLASQYAQLSTSIWSASQENFEQQIDNIVRYRDQYINWYQTVMNLSNVVGKDNLCVLLYENIGKVDFWQEFGMFMVGDSFLTEVIIKNSQQGPKENVRSSNKLGRWKIRNFSSKKLAEEMLFQNSKILRKGVRPLFKKEIATKLDSYKNKRREQEIILTSEIKNKIKSYCLDSNDKLSLFLGRDLKSLGY